MNKNNNSLYDFSCCHFDSLPYADFFKALCEPTRLRILAAIISANRPCSVSEIASLFPVDISVVSRHLAFMRQQGILRASKTGREVRYAIHRDFILQMIQDFIAVVERCCPSSEERGENFLRSH